MALLIQLVYHQTAGIYQTAMIAGDDDEHARGRRGLVDDWVSPAVGLDWHEFHVLSQSTAVFDVADGVAAAAAKTVWLVASSDRIRMLVPVQPGNAHAASWQIHPSCTAASGRGSCAA